MRLRGPTCVALGLAAALAIGCGEQRLAVLTYNVAGLPAGLSASAPEQNMPLIAPLLDDFDIALLQEDFAFHGVLARGSQLPHRLPASLQVGEEAGGAASGLSRFSKHGLTRVYGERWRLCNGTREDGSDCLAPKGFTVAEHTLEIGNRIVAIDVYNLHMDSGDGDGDRSARQAQLNQLLGMMQTRSSEKAIIVAGDTNLDERDTGALSSFLEDAALEDACETLNCGETERIDRVFYRSSEWVALTPLSYDLPSQFVDLEGQPLSDHLPVVVQFEVAVSAGLGLSLQAPQGSGMSDTFGSSNITFGSSNEATTP